MVDRGSSRWGGVSRRNAAPVAFAFLLSLTLGLIHGGFPLGYHSDEPTKVELVREGTNSFFHPLLLLTATRAVCAVAPGRESDAAIVRIGRTFSALMAALAVAGLTGAALIGGGRRAAWCVGVLTALSPALVLRAHYMKEDAALLGGMGLCAWAMAWWLGRRTRRAQVALGLACGVVASAKYVGLVWILFALVALRPRNGDGARSRVSRWRVPFFAALLGALAAINYPMLLAPVAARKGIGYESFHVVSSHLALVVPRLSSARFVLLWRETPPPVLVVGLAWIGWCVATWRRRSGFERFMALFPVGFFALTHASVVAWGRYLLPVVVWLHYLAGRAVAEWTSGRGRGRGATWWAVLAVMALAAWPAWRTGRVLEQLGDDGRTRLRVWAALHLPPDSRVAFTVLLGLPGGPWGGPATGGDRGVCGVRASGRLERFQTIDRLREDTRADYVAVSALSYQRYFDPWAQAAPEEESSLRDGRAFYDRLFREGELLFEDPSPDWTGTFTDPPVRLYRLPER